MNNPIFKFETCSELSEQLPYNPTMSDFERIIISTIECEVTLHEDMSFIVPSYIESLSSPFLYFACERGGITVNDGKVIDMWVKNKDDIPDGFHYSPFRDCYMVDLNIPLRLNIKIS